MDTNIVHLIRKQFLNFQKDFGTSLELDLGKVDGVQVDFFQIVGDLSL